MSKNGIIVLVIVIIVAAGLIWWSADQQSVDQSTNNQVASTEPIKLGWVGPLSGDAVSYGEPMKNAFALAVEEINSQGGINGRKLEVIYEDGKCSGKDAASAAQKLINIDGVKIMVGGICSGENLAIAPITEPQEIIVFTIGSSPEISDIGEYIFRNTPSDIAGARTMAEFVINKGYKKLAIISENTDYAQANGLVFKNAIKELGGEIVADENYTPGTKDFRSTLIKIKATNPDAIFINPQTEQSGGNIVVQLKELGIGVQLFGGNAFTGEVALDVSGEGSEGMYAIAAPSLNTNNPIAKKFLDNYKQKYGEIPIEFYLGASRDFVYILSQAIAKVGTDTDKIKDYLYNMKGFSGIIGDYYFDEKGDVSGVNYKIQLIKDGQPIDI